jgi:type I restriction enzyme S subunit
LNEFLNLERTARRLRGLATRGVSQSNISATKLRNFEVSLPDTDTQDAISRKISVLGEWMGQQDSRCDALRELCASLLHNLMTGKVRVMPAEADMEGV